jgi:hypothetical protein
VTVAIRKAAEALLEALGTDYPEAAALRAALDGGAAKRPPRATIGAARAYSCKSALGVKIHPFVAHACGHSFRGDICPHDACKAERRARAAAAPVRVYSPRAALYRAHARAIEAGEHSANPEPWSGRITLRETDDGWIAAERDGKGLCVAADIWKAVRGLEAHLRQPEVA